jgi:ribonuclease HII
MKFIEQILLDAGITPIAGVDEAGRGACAGPLLVAAVILRDFFASELTLLRDSKALTERMREGFYEIICEQSVAISIIVISADEVDSRGVHIANLEGMRRAILGLSIPPSFVLTDGYAIPGLGTPTLGVWKGDQVVRTISAASIIAKVTRDRMMRQLDSQYPDYGFARHKGYVTEAHRIALATNGPCPIHRRSFSNVAALINTND